MLLQTYSVARDDPSSNGDKIVLRNMDNHWRVYLPVIVKHSVFPRGSISGMFSCYLGGLSVSALFSALPSSREKTCHVETDWTLILKCDC